MNRSMRCVSMLLTLVGCAAGPADAVNQIIPLDASLPVVDCAVEADPIGQGDPADTAGRGVAVSQLCERCSRASRQPRQQSGRLPRSDGVSASPR